MPADKSREPPFFPRRTSGKARSLSGRWHELSSYSRLARALLLAAVLRTCPSGTMSPSTRCALMTTQKKATKKPARRKAPSAKAQRRSAPKVRALAIADPVLREDVSQPHGRDGLMQMAFAWSPLGLLAAQTAFWAGLVGVAPR